MSALKPIWEITCGDAAATRRLAEALCAQLGPGRAVGLRGGLGAGKTTFVQGLAMGLGEPEGRSVVSPTYAYANEYALPRGALVHLDLYRLEDALQAEQLGLLELIERRDALVAIEWPERLAALLPAHIAWVDLSDAESGGRRCRIAGLYRPPGWPS